MGDDRPSRSILDAISKLAAPISAVLIPIAIALAGHFASLALREKESQLRMIELAVDILKAPPIPDQSESGIRNWAADILQRHSGVTLTTDARSEVLERRLPVKADMPTSTRSIGSFATGSKSTFDVCFMPLRFFGPRSEGQLALAASILEIDPDVVALTEVQQGSLELVMTYLKGGGKLFEVAYGATGGNQRLAVMWNTERVEIREGLREMDIDEVAQVRVFPRKPVVLELQSREVEESPVVCLVHIHLRSQRRTSSGDGSAERREASEFLAARVAEFRAEGKAVILGGITNQRIEAPEFAMLRGMDGMRLVTRDDMYTWFDKSQQRGAALTHVFVDQEMFGMSGKTTISVMDAVVGEYRDIVSDHFPLLVSIPYAE